MLRAATRGRRDLRILLMTAAGGRSPRDAMMVPELGQRIMILGCAGSGKSTLARNIGRVLGLPVHHLDQLFWQPGWRESERAVFDAAVVARADEPRWVIDGNYLRTAEVRVRRADTVIWLGLPLSVCLARVLWRMLRDHGRTRDDMPAACPEQFDPVFLAWIWNFRRHTRPRILHLLAAAESGPAVIRLASRRAVARLMAETAT